MKANKHKRIKRILDYYRQLYELKEPYRVLVDGSFVFAALKHRIHVKEQLAELLGGKVFAYVTNCIVNELRDMGDDVSGATVVLKRYQRLNCTHAENEKGPNSRRCIVSAVSRRNHQKLFVATQDQTLITWLRKSGDVPIIKLNNNVVFLEHPPKCSKEHKSEVEKSKLLPKEWEKPYLPVMTDATSAPPKEKRKTKGPKGPNPLSCLKPKRKETNSTENAGNISQATGRKRRRKSKSGTPSDVAKDATASSEATT